MSKHLSQDEIQQIISQNPKNLESNRFLHFENCAYCKSLYHSQMQANIILSQIKPRKAPAVIANKVIQSVELLAKQSIPGKKTDWVFLLAVITLFAIGSWLLFSGKIVQFMPQSVTQIVSEQKQVVEENQYIDTVKELLPKVEFNIKMPGITQYSFIIMMGIISIIFYYLIDRKLNQIYRIRKT